MIWTGEQILIEEVRQRSLSALFAELAENSVEVSPSRRTPWPRRWESSASCRSMRPQRSVYTRVRHDLEVVGQPIGALDTLIAAYALSIKAVLVTHNSSEFDRVRGLVVQDWQAGVSD